MGIHLSQKRSYPFRDTASRRWFVASQHDRFLKIKTKPLYPDWTFTFPHDRKSSLSNDPIQSTRERSLTNGSPTNPNQTTNPNRKSPRKCFGLPFFPPHTLTRWHPRGTHHRQRPRAICPVQVAKASDYTPFSLSTSRLMHTIWGFWGVLWFVTCAHWSLPVRWSLSVVPLLRINNASWCRKCSSSSSNWPQSLTSSRAFQACSLCAIDPGQVPELGSIIRYEATLGPFVCARRM